MGGEVGVESIAGAGSRFTFTLPLRTIARAGGESAALPCGRVTPRSSVVTSVPARLPASRAGLPGSSASVSIEPS